MAGFAPALLLASLVGSQNPIGALKKATGLQGVLFNDKSGFRYLEIRYSKVKTEHPKVGFFRLGLPILKISDLELILYPEQAEYPTLRDKLRGLAKSKAMRFVLAEPAELRIVRDKKLAIEIRAGRAKVGSDGSLKCYAGVSITEGNATKTIPAIQLFADDTQKRFRFISPDGKEFAEVTFPPQSTRTKDIKE
tara:strand:+ start:447 stop:1025 length:579 start_codon:yes stop_codon:yes gene_type:complete